MPIELTGEKSRAIARNTLIRLYSHNEYLTDKSTVGAKRRRVVKATPTRPVGVEWLGAVALAVVVILILFGVINR